MDRRPLVFIFLATCFFQSFGQSVNESKSAYYVNDDGRLFWRKSAPLYLFASEEADRLQHQLKSAATQEHTNPFYLDTEGRNYIRSSNAVDPETKKSVPGQEVLFEIYADSKPPVTSAQLENVFKHQSADGLTYYKSGLEISVSSIDELSGVGELFTGLDNRAMALYTTTFSFTEGREHSIRFNAEDNVGNVEDVKSLVFTIDPDPPFTDLNINGITDDNVVSKSSRLYFIVEDSLSGVDKVYFKFDEADFQEYDGGVLPVAALTEGNHTISYYSVDNVTNKETPQSFTFFLDKSAPLMVADILGDRFIVDDEIYFSGRTKLKLTAVDNKVGVKEVMFSVDGENFKKYDQPFYLPSVSGTHTIRYYSVDNLDNSTIQEAKSRFVGEGGFEEFKHNVAKFYVDLTGPVIDHSIGTKSFTRRDTLYLGPKSTLSLSGEDPESGLNHLSYILNNGVGEVIYDGDFTLEGQATEGFNSLNYFGYDNVNNRNVSEFSFYYDGTVPEIGYQFSIGHESTEGGKRVYPEGARIFLYATDKTSGVSELEYDLDGKGMRDYRGAVDALTVGEHTLTIKSTDLLGNTSSETVSFHIR